MKVKPRIKLADKNCRFHNRQFYLYIAIATVIHKSWRENITHIVTVGGDTPTEAYYNLMTKIKNNDFELCNVKV